MTTATTPAAPAASKRRGGDGAGSWALLLLPALLIVAIMFVLPVGIMAWRSISDPELGLGNYAWFFGNETAVRALARTFWVGLIVTVVCLALAYPYAYLMTIAGPKATMALTLLALLPFWTSLMVRTFAWVVLLQDTGVVNSLLGYLGLGPFSIIRTTTGVVIGMAQILLPFMVLPLYAVMSGIDRRLLLAAESLGARPTVAFMKIFVPLSLPGVAAGSLTVFITALGFYVTPALLGSPDRALISQQIFTQVSGLLEWGKGGAMGLILLIFTLLILGVGGAIIRISQAKRSG